MILDFPVMQRMIEFLITDSSTGEVKYRHRMRVQLDRDCYPERHFEKYLRHMIAIFRASDDPKYSNCVCQFSQIKPRYTTQGVLFNDSSDLF